MSATAVRSEYAALLSSALPAVIRSGAENERYIALLEELARKGNRMTAAERRMAELLTLLIEDFEDKHYALKASNPVDVLAELMSANNLKQKDLLDGSAPPASFQKFSTASGSSLPSTFADSAGDSTCRRKSLSSS
jgi:antitoxin component HigA of HigAB toxin-antitoxin module